MNTEKIAEFLVMMETPVKVFLMFLVFLYVIWFWKVGPYDGLMKTVNGIKIAVEKTAVGTYMALAWFFIGIGRVFRVIFATVRDFFMSRI